MSQPAADDAVRRVKVPPHSIEAEQSVLGGLLLDDRTWDLVADRVAAADFYRPGHRIIYDVMARLANGQQPLDVVTVSEAIREQGLAEKTGGAAYLAELAESTPAAGNAGAYAAIVRERSVLRQILRVTGDVSAAVFEPEGRTSAELLELAEQAVFRIAEGRLQGAGPRQIGALLDEAQGRIEQLAESGGGLTGAATGFEDLDRLTAGLQASDLIVIAGRPSMGKTALAVNIAEHVLLSDPQDTRPVVLFSLEQPVQQIVLRLLSSLGSIDYERLRTGRLDDHDWPRMASAIRQLKGRPLYIDDEPALTPNDVRARVRRLARTAGAVKLIVVDYLQLMRTHGQSETRTLEIAEITRSLKALAKEADCPLVALSQLNRSLESREDKRPRMSDLRESGAIEQDADLILFLYREEVYDRDTQHKGGAELIVGKQRNGPIGSVNLRFTGNLMKFETSAGEEGEN